MFASKMFAEKRHFCKQKCSICKQKDFFAKTAANIRRQKVIDVEKLQGDTYKGLNIRAEKSNVAARMNIKNYFEQYKDGRGYTDILRDVTKQVISAPDHKSEINISELSDYEAMKHKFSVELVPTKGNEEMLESVPHKMLKI